ncbi:asparagine synthase (glutamine-hydrolyzing) [Micromonospora sp. WMMC273]|uniref:asparagine synthase (glutamine-hydrolyzing) n=1 Tax=Micromonospora sp. WMMC273 TaxID=3015157 RepID=UPI0022B6EAB9|nr:asparagine synthase (glutamine-hydrolyzing) [Micromonospora sp. WMMC273]MCZ7472998.1 asparagine synthase (glutamine-hydrolyzing) [Micromonospora sp. WMMC273]
MCGLGGLARVDGCPLTDAADAVLSTIATTIGHRGPDDREVTREGPVGLAFTRLSLIDPEGGAQPLVSPDGSLVLIANGEVYNHRQLAAGQELLTGSDCEVLLGQYARHGIRFLENVHGMFAVVLWDRRANKLILARDRFGIKPLYYHRTAERIIFSSEIKALFADPGTPRKVDWGRALVHPMMSSAPVLVPMEQTTWFQEIHSVPAATVMEIDLGTGATTERRYWDFPTAGEGEGMSDRELTERYGALLAESVADCATADAELGLFLSGGIDSSAVAALAVGRSTSLHTFTALSGSTHLNGDAANARRVADHLGLPNHQVVFDAARVPSVDEWKRLLWLLETPLCGVEQFYKHELHRYARTERPELRGMLLGAASDEFNGGYSVDYGLGGDWHSFEGSLATMMRNGAIYQRPELAPWWSQLAEPILRDDVVFRLGATTPPDPYQAFLEREYAKIQQYNCWHEDRTAAGSGIEARVPFLDHRLVELVVGVPAAQRSRLLWDKRILRDATRHLLPASIVNRPKVPFYYGAGEQHTYRMLARMLSQDGGALVEEALAGGDAADHLDAAGVRQLMHRITERPESQDVELALQAINLGLLASMAAEVPAPIVTRPLDIKLSAIDGVDLSPESGHVAEHLGYRPVVHDKAVLEFGPEALLLRSMDDEDWFLILNGEIEYVIDTESPVWRRFLAGVDGVRSVEDLLDLAGGSWTDVESFVYEAVEHRILRVAGATVDG